MTRSTTRAALRHVLILLLCLAGSGTACRYAVAQAGTPPLMLAWEYEAVVIDISDPDHLFPELRLGDPVHGVIRYDAALFHYFHLGVIAFYTHDVGIEVASMIIENPRTGVAIEFAEDENGCCRDVDVGDDVDDSGADDVYDYLAIYQSVEAPPGFDGTDPVVEAYFSGPVPTQSAITLPLAIELDDWPVATVSFFDLYASSEDGVMTFIDAEISALTPLTAPYAAGDFDYDYDVDGDDFEVWNSTFGSTSTLYADGDGDFDVDGADFLAWQRRVGSTSTAVSANGPVPEPTTPLLFIVAAAGIRRLGGRTRHAHIRG